LRIALPPVLIGLLGEDALGLKPVSKLRIPD
jgi:hypothetical protein